MAARPSPVRAGKAADLPQASYSADVFAPAETLWALLIDQIERPERYLPGILAARITERSESHILRTLTGSSRAMRRVSEKVSVNKQALLIEYKLLDHPLFEGGALHQVLPHSDHATLTFAITWTPRGDVPETTLDQNAFTALAESAVRPFKDLAEALARD